MMRRALTLSLAAAALLAGPQAPAQPAAPASAARPAVAAASRPAPRPAAAASRPAPRPAAVAASRAAARPAAAPAASAPAAARDTSAALNALDTRLVAGRSSGTPARNAFEARTWTLPPPAAAAAASAAPPPPPPPPPPPVAPPLPYKYMGMLQESPTRTVWYLLAGDRLVVGATGEVVDTNYRIEGTEGGQLHLTYLPLKQRQSLAIGATP